MYVINKNVSKRKLNISEQDMKLIVLSSKELILWTELTLDLHQKKVIHFNSDAAELNV